MKKDSTYLNKEADVTASFCTYICIYMYLEKEQGEGRTHHDRFPLTLKILD